MSVLSQLFAIPRVVIHTDGSCDNTLVGGWCAIIRTGMGSFSISGAEVDTTNNRMEVLAVVSALEQIRCNADIVVYSDSQYVVTGCKFATMWAERNWKNRDNAPIKNRDLWERYLELTKYHKITAIWQKGHDGEVCNCLCDTQAKAVRDHLKTLKKCDSITTKPCSADDFVGETIFSRKLADEFVRRSLEGVVKELKAA